MQECQQASASRGKECQEHNVKNINNVDSDHIPWLGITNCAQQREKVFLGHFVVCRMILLPPCPFWFIQQEGRIQIGIMWGCENRTRSYCFSLLGVVFPSLFIFFPSLFCAARFAHGKDLLFFFKLAQLVTLMLDLGLKGAACPLSFFTRSSSLLITMKVFLFFLSLNAQENAQDLMIALLAALAAALVTDIRGLLANWVSPLCLFFFTIFGDSTRSCSDSLFCGTWPKQMKKKIKRSMSSSLRYQGVLGDTEEIKKMKHFEPEMSER